MFGVDLLDLYDISVYVIPALLAITLHEAAHGWVAKQLGDPTAFKLGRVTANPIKHIDPIGTILVPLVLGYASGGTILFGWAKPVPVVFQNLRRPRRDMMLVAAAGPISNLAMASLWTLLAIVFWAVGAYTLVIGGWLLVQWEKAILINSVLMIVNLIPIPPLDGGRIATGLLLPEKAATVLARYELFGLIIVVLLMVPPIAVLWTIIEPGVVYFDLLFRAIFSAVTGLHE
jgi:Zn-dependent protease